MCLPSGPGSRTASAPPAAVSDAVVRLETRSPEATRELGAELGRAAFPGAVLLLEGPVGAGKTELARGLARGLDVAAAIASPSYTILAAYRGRLPLLHLDLYRVSDPSELRSIDLDEVFDSEGVAVVEWPRWLLASPPPGALEVRLRWTAPERRGVELRPRDPRWTARLPRRSGGGSVP